MTGVAPVPDLDALASAQAALGRIREAVESIEDELFATLAITGDPDTQRALDAWVDGAVDAARGIGAAATEQRQRLTLHAEPRRSPQAGGDRESAECRVDRPAGRVSR